MCTRISRTVGGCDLLRAAVGVVVLRKLKLRSSCSAMCSYHGGGQHYDSITVALSPTCVLCDLAEFCRNCSSYIHKYISTYRCLPIFPRPEFSNFLFVTAVLHPLQNSP